MGSVPFALQLYTVRDHLERDVPGTLKRVKEIGYDYVELAGMGPYGPREYSALLAGAGLTATGSHFAFDEITKNTNSVIETVQALGLAYAVVPWVGGAMCPDKAHWVACAKAMDAAGATFRAAGITLCYHNHAHEFETFDGQYIIDLIFASSAPQHLAAELDTYWIQYGGANPVDLIDRYAGRCPLLHVKDMSAGPSRTFAEVGRGILDWPRIFAAAAKAGVRRYIVEQDTCPGDPLESARISAEYMRAL